MYYLYQEDVDDNKTVFKRLGRVSLAGCTNGLIAMYLKKTIDSTATEPYCWHITRDKLFEILSLRGNALVIDVKPNSKEELSLFKIKNIWGYSSSGWTPILLELKRIVHDESPDRYDRKNVELEDYKEGDSVFTLLYLKGTIRNGKLECKWVFPGPSPTNSVLLWTDARNYFIRKMSNG